MLTWYDKAEVDELLAGKADPFPPPLTSTIYSFSPAHSSVVRVPFAPLAGETRWDGATWTGAGGYYLAVLKMRLNDGAPGGANIAIGIAANGSERLTWRTLPASPNRETLISFEVIVLNSGNGLYAEAFVDSSTDVGFQQCDLSIIPVGHPI
jgi:hypothetical protein